MEFPGVLKKEARLLGGSTIHYYYYSYFCLFSILHVNVYIMNNFSLYLTYWRVGISCLDHLFLDDFPMVFIPCFHPDVMEINFRFYFSNAIIRKVFFILRIALFLPRNVLFDLSLLKHEFNSSTYIYIRGFFMFFNWYANNALCCMISLLCLFCIPMTWPLWPTNSIMCAPLRFFLVLLTGCSCGYFPNK